MYLLYEHALGFLWAYNINNARHAAGAP